MNTDPESLNDLIEAAVFERGAITHLETLERKVQRRKLWLRTAIAVAASLILAVGVNMLLLFTHDYDETQISNMIADVYNYHANYDNMAEAGFGLGNIENLY